MSEASTSNDKPGKGLLGWLGRQVGHVTKAVKYDPLVVERREDVREATDPDHPGLTFRRTVVDEVRRELPARSSPPKQGD